MNPPLAEQLRPQRLEEYIGQTHLMGQGAVLEKAILSGNLPSIILWGPPGVGKTTLAYLISKYLDRPFFTLSAVLAGVKDVREVLDKAERMQKSTALLDSPSLFESAAPKPRNPQGKRPILFIDEIHRFSKSQQDSLLGAVEKGTITFIGATTENPSFEVISPLLSRCQVYVLQNLSSEELDELIARAVNHIRERYHLDIQIKESNALKRISGGDGRKLLNAIELVAGELMADPKNAVQGARPVVTDRLVTSLIQQNLATYDKDGENHYDIISAFIKSLRGSDPNAAVYYLARMLSAGEDVKFIARRMVILASEDIGNANPNALLLANACFDTVHKIGYPECRITLSQTAVYLACSPKSNASYMAIDAALAEIKQSGDLPVPLHLRNAPTKLMKELGYHDGYRYAHDFEGNFTEQEFLPEQLSGKTFYEPGNNPKENEMRSRLQRLWKDKYGY
ncbi:MAG: replication-associated recombination protein A [Bacteroides sp.]|nr:replication-associated recombination protein A [Bacteroides sp.]